MTNQNEVYDVAEWIVYNIKELGHQYNESGSSLSFFYYIKSRVAVSLQLKYPTNVIDDIFGDDRIKTIIQFYEEDGDESEDQIH